MLKSPSTLRGRILFASAIMILAFITASFFDRYLKNDVMLVLLSAIVFCSLYCGLWIGMSVAALTAITHSYFFQLPRQAIRIHSWEDFFELCLLLGFSIFLSSVGDQLKKAQRAREEILAIVSHDLKNPLAAIRLGVDALERNSANVPPAVLAGKLKRIRNSTERALKLVSELLDFEKMRAGKFIVEMREESLQPLFEDLATELGPLAEVKGLALRINISDSSQKAIFDRNRLYQVLANLIGNSIKFSASGTEVVAGYRKSISGDSIECFVTDQGPGIRNEDLPKIFDRYWQAKKTEKQGSGLGLAIAKGVIEAHRGKIRAESKEGEGSSFFFTINTR